MLSWQLRQHPDVYTEHEKDGLVVLAPDGEIFRFNGVAEFVWEHMNGELTLEQLVEAILVEYETPTKDQVQADVLKFARFLKEKKLVAD
jgi:hypothetical protein